MSKDSSYNGYFAWLKHWKIDNNTPHFGDHRERPPYPPIIIDPTFKQCLQSWNKSDTGCFLFWFAFGIFMTRIHCNYALQVSSLGNKRTVFNMYFGLYTTMALYFGLVNTAHRLVGFTPNGLQWDIEPEREMNKYQLTNNFVKNSFWRWFVTDEYLKRPPA